MLKKMFQDPRAKRGFVLYPVPVNESPDAGAQALVSLKRPAEDALEEPCNAGNDNEDMAEDADAPPGAQVVLGKVCTGVVPGVPLNPWRATVREAECLPQGDQPVEQSFIERLMSVSKAADKFGSIIRGSLCENSAASASEARTLTEEESQELRNSYVIIAEQLGFCFSETLPPMLEDAGKLERFRTGVRGALFRLAINIVGNPIAADKVKPSKVSVAVVDRQYIDLQTTSRLAELDFKTAVTVGRPYFGNNIVLESRYRDCSESMYTSRMQAVLLRNAKTKEILVVDPGTAAGARVIFHGPNGPNSIAEQKSTPKDRRVLIIPHDQTAEVDFYNGGRLIFSPSPCVRCMTAPAVMRCSCNRMSICVSCYPSFYMDGCCFCSVDTMATN